ncbi:hypothetical protein LguiA_008481 [Lonicera macranthoides]
MYAQFEYMFRATGIQPPNPPSDGSSSLAHYIPFGALSFVKNIHNIGNYNWSSAILAWVYFGLDVVLPIAEASPNSDRPQIWIQARKNLEENISKNQNNPTARSSVVEVFVRKYVSYAGTNSLYESGETESFPNSDRF